jgi:hypothetical protein
MRYPKGLFLGTRKFMKTHVLDDLFFEFLIYYVAERTRRRARAAGRSGTGVREEVGG